MRTWAITPLVNQVIEEKNDCTVRRLYHLFSGSISPKMWQAHDNSSLLDESEQVDYGAFSPPATKEETKQSKGQRGWYDVFYNY